MKNKKTNKWIIPTVIIIIVVVFGIAVIALKYYSKGEEERDSYDEEIIIINKTFPVDVVIFGDSIEFRPEFEYRMIEDITDELLIFNKSKYLRLVIIVNDLSSTVSLTEKQYKIIKRGIENDIIDFYYLGTRLINKLIEYEIWNAPLGEGELAVCLALYNRNLTYFSGIWSEYDVKMAANNKEALGSAIISQIARCIKSNN